MQQGQPTTLVVNASFVSHGGVAVLVPTCTSKPTPSSTKTPAETIKLLLVWGLTVGQLGHVKMGLFLVWGVRVNDLLTSINKSGAPPAHPTLVWCANTEA